MFWYGNKIEHATCQKMTKDRIKWKYTRIYQTIDKNKICAYKRSNKQLKFKQNAQHIDSHLQTGSNSRNNNK